ncbi:soma ferritin-like [Vespula pensylvanica]|uniref:soma ferritin-like n=1 Tax=Vespula pensylvanica TaxID=30213 RepID=UPI001CBA290B|nr:soma ferritin-like [Vespula pensylvanica]
MLATLLRRCNCLCNLQIKIYQIKNDQLFCNNFLNTNIKGNFVTTCIKENSKKVSPDDSAICIDKPLEWPTGKRAHFKFHEETEAAMNKQINAEFKAFYYYLSLAAYFGRVDVALPGCESYFMQMHQEEHEHALRFVDYVKMRGGQVILCPILPPVDPDWKCPLHAFKTALGLEIEISEQLVDVNTIAEKHGDLNASDFIITGFMENQMKSVNEMARFVTVLSGIGDQALARFVFDKDLLDNHVSSEFNVIKKKLRFKINEKVNG